MAKYVFLIFTFMSLSSSVRCEAFGNNSLNIPHVGAIFFDSLFSEIQKPWGIGTQWSVGTSYKQALDYQWWWVVETTFASGTLSFDDEEFVSSFLGGAGVRYNFLYENLRPYSGVLLHYLQFLGNKAKNLPLNLDWPIFVGLKPHLGIEWLFYSEMALVLECAYALYFNIHESFKHALFSHVSFAFYF
ncbi:MAG: hypothetical protein KC505_03790 [Myxococcales bacterium]|nr:hypothetical protein [Myxococcales bacterium]USN49974.1 MAG: hypothetical protein H6731_06785 [Myxococcales bacterium]